MLASYFLALLPAVLALPQKFDEGKPVSPGPAVCQAGLCCSPSFDGGVPDPSTNVGNVFHKEKRQGGNIAPGDNWGFPGISASTFPGVDFDYAFCKKCRDEGHCKKFTISSD